MVRLTVISGVDQAPDKVMARCTNPVWFGSRGMQWLLIFFMLFLSACRSVDGGPDDLGECQSKAERIADNGFDVDIVRYRPEGSPDRAIVIMPPTGGTTFLESRYATLFCDAGFVVYVVEGWTGMSETSLDLRLHHRLFGRAQRAIERILEAAPESFIGLMGTSVGGLHAATAVGHLPRVSAAFVIAAGAPVVDILAYTDQKALQSLRERRIREFGFDDQQAYRDALSAEFDWEPLSYLDEAREKPLGVIVVRGDETVPTVYQRELREAWQPSVDFSVHGFPLAAHMVGILQAWWLHADDIRDFFARHAPDPGQNMPQTG